MKKLLLLAVMIFTIISLSSAQVLLFQASSSSYKMVIGDTFTDWTGWIDNECIINFNTETDIVSINNGYADKFKVLEVSELEYGTLNSENYKQTVMSAIDKDGIFCKLTVRNFYELKNYHIYIAYIDYIYVYECDLIEF